MVSSHRQGGCIKLPLSLVKLDIVDYLLLAIKRIDSFRVLLWELVMFRHLRNEATIIVWNVLHIFIVTDNIVNMTWLYCSHMVTIL